MIFSLSNIQAYGLTAPLPLKKKTSRSMFSPKQKTDNTALSARSKTGRKNFPLQRRKLFLQKRRKSKNWRILTKLFSLFFPPRAFTKPPLIFLRITGSPGAPTKKFWNKYLLFDNIKHGARRHAGFIKQILPKMLSAVLMNGKTRIFQPPHKALLRI